MYESQLENIGLNGKEARIYLSLLEIGESPVSKVAEHSKINRVTCYDVLDKLIKKSFVTEIDYTSISFLLDALYSQLSLFYSIKIKSKLNPVGYAVHITKAFHN